MQLLSSQEELLLCKGELKQTHKANHALEAKLSEAQEAVLRLEESHGSQCVQINSLESALEASKAVSQRDLDALRDTLGKDRAISEALQAQAWESATEALEESLKAERKVSSAALVRVKRLEQERNALELQHESVTLERDELLDALGEERLTAQDRNKAISGLVMTEAVKIDSDEGLNFERAVSNLPRIIQRNLLIVMMEHIRGDRLAERLAVWRRKSIEDTLALLHVLSSPIPIPHLVCSIR